MAALSTPICDFGWPAVDFELPSTTGTRETLASLRGPQGLLLMFICNHCPYVKAILERLCRDVEEIKALGFGVAAIMSNDTLAYPEDSFDNMKRLASSAALPFAYLYDESQQVAKAYGAVCTPDFFGFNRDLQLQYRGRIDADGRNPFQPGTKRELVEAMRQIAETGQGPTDQFPSIGCSIKWKA